MQVILTRAEKRRLIRLVKNITYWTKVTLVIALFVTMFGMLGRIETRYNINANIIELNEFTYTATDVAGYEWTFECEEYVPVGATVKLQMHTNYTSNRDDDIVKNIKIIK